jgi:hypothetical protein
MHWQECTTHFAHQGRPFSNGKAHTQLYDVIMKRGRDVNKTINQPVWNQVDGREGTPLYDVYNQITIKQLG